MYSWLIDTFGEQGALYITYAGGAIVVLVLVWVLWFWTRRVSGGVFVHGGRGRQPRLAVVDAAAIDSHRRIVLVRRDDVEHLVMIGGHNDFVIERNIGKASAESMVATERTAPAEPEKPAKREAPVRHVEPEKPAEPAVEAVAPPAPEPPAPPREEPKRTPVMPEHRPVASPPPPPPPAPPAPPQAQTPPPPPRDLAPPPPPPPARPAPVVAPEAPQSELPGAYAEFEPVVPAPRPSEPAFSAGSASRMEREPVMEEEFEEVIAAAPPPAARPEPQPAVEPTAPDPTLEDEMQKLLAELTRKK